MANTIVRKPVDGYYPLFSNHISWIYLMKTGRRISCTLLIQYPVYYMALWNT